MTTRRRRQLGGGAAATAAWRRRTVQRQSIVKKVVPQYGFDQSSEDCLLEMQPTQPRGSSDHSAIIWILLHINSSVRRCLEYVNSKEVKMLLIYFWCSFDESIQVQLLCINFKCAITVDCSEPMPLKEELPLHDLDGETPSFLKVGEVGGHKEVLVVLRRHTQSFR